MPEITNESVLNKRRFEQNVEQTETEQDDEDKLQEIAEFMLATAEEFLNPALANTIRDMANTIVTNKSALAKGGGEVEEPLPGEGEVPLPPPGMAGVGLPPAPLGI